jgi:drug/metabolite transporter (DMT)-like permease
LPALSDNARGALLMMASMASFTLNDVFMKSLSDELPLFQALALRGLVTTLFLVLLARRLGLLRFDLARRDWGLIAVRTIAEIGAAYFFITAIFNMPIANATAILQVLPLTVTLAGAVFLGEAVGWRRLSAIIVGFVGVLLIVRPGAEGFTVYSVYALIAVVFVTVRDLVVRRMSDEVPSLTIAVCASAGVAGFAALASLGIDWQPLSQTALLQLGAAGVLIIGGYMFSIMAMRVGEVAVVTPAVTIRALSPRSSGHPPRRSRIGERLRCLRFADA